VKIGQMRVLLVNAHGTPDGGTETGLAELARALIAKGVDVSFLIAFAPADLVEGVPATVLHKSHWRTSTSRRLASHVEDVASWPSDRLDDVLATHAPDIVHTHNLPGTGTGIWEAARRRRIPVIHTLHDYHLLCPRTTLMRRDGSGACRPHPLLCGLRTRLLGRWVGGVDRVLAVSQHLHDAHARVFQGTEAGLMRNPVRPLPRLLGAPGAQLRRIGYIGALHRNKGVDVLLRALPGLEERGLVLRIAGRGALQGDVLEAARRTTALEYVGFAVDDDKLRFMEGCDLGVLPSIWQEPGGPTWSMSEWLGAGRPVLVSPVGGLAEVAGTYPGSVATEPTVEAILSSVDQLLDRQRWASMVQDAQNVDPRAFLDGWVGAHLAVYAELHARRHGRT
jgi:glycosyltransferase involved in cell wall biosynthesis